jgi:hypothetical protein
LNFKTLKVAKTEFKPTIALKNKNEVNMGLIVRGLGFRVYN